MAGGTHDLSGASEDELLRGMRPQLYAIFLVSRCVTICFDVVADSLLFYIFLPCAVQGVTPPSSAVIGWQLPLNSLTPLLPPLPVAAAALSYGSQHLRWRGEWLLAAVFGAAQLGLCHAFGGRLIGPLGAAMPFAIFRYLRRSQDVRRFHAQ